LELLNHLGLPDAVVEEVSLDFSCEGLSGDLSVVECLDEVLQLHVLVFLHGLHNSWTQMGLLLHLVWQLVQHVVYVLVLLSKFQQKLLPVFICFVQNGQQLLHLLWIIGVLNEVLSLQIEHIIFTTCLSQLLFYLLGLIPGLQDLLLEEDFITILFIHLELLLLDGFVMHLRHISQKQSLLSNLR